MARHSAEDIVPDGQMDSQLAWFCLRSQPKHERVAAANLGEMGIEALNPRVRYPRPSKNGPVWVVESMFPNYLFAQFNWRTSLNAVHYARGVAGIVHFGPRWPTVPECIIDGIRALIGTEGFQTQEPKSDFAIGDTVAFSTGAGAWHGLEAVVKKVMPGQQRVAVLMHFLGQQMAIEVPAELITKRLYR